MPDLRELTVDGLIEERNIVACAVGTQLYWDGDLRNGVYALIDGSVGVTSMLSYHHFMRDGLTGRLRLTDTIDQRWADNPDSDVLLRPM